jgi:hypothetical protein
MSKSNLISPDFTEDNVSLMIQILLTVQRFPRAPFALVPLSKKDEVLYGADAYIESISPLYIQFKRSFAYPDFSRSKIIKDRKILSVNYSPRTLFFELRDKQPIHKDYQHNVLFDLRTRLDISGKGTAFYTAPLFLRRASYLNAIHKTSIFSWRPWNSFMDDPFYRELQYIITPKGSIRFQNIPILREHIVIPPHERVTTHKHKYSYLENGNEICFHEPTKLDGEQTLGQTIYEYLKFQDGQPTTQMTNLQESISLLNGLQNELFEENQFSQKENILESWLDFGEKLRTEYEIFQFMLIKFKNG